MTLQRPDWAIQVAFNADPGDPLTPPLWSDLTTMTMNAGSIARGQQYEMAIPQAVQPQILFRDPDEYLNPANTASPYYPQVQPYRQLLWQGMWPNGGTGNLLNAGTWLTPIDPSFDSYTAGAAVSWLTAVGATTPVVGTTTPHSSANDVTWTVASTTTVQGASWQVPCIPGRQYTASAYVRQSTASTQLIQVTDQNLVLDQYLNRTVGSGWGTAPLGGAWSVLRSANIYAVAANLASATPTVVATDYVIAAGSGITDANLVARVTPPVVATGALYSAGVVARAADANNMYLLRLRFDTDNTVGVEITKMIAGVLTSLVTTTAVAPYQAGMLWWLHAQVIGPTLQVRAWQDDARTNEPTAWQATITDTSLTAGGAVGMVFRAETGNTNLPIAMPVTSFSATGAVNGTTTSATGAYNRISVTWTATQPSHTIQVATSGTAVAGTVLLDDVQHEPGGSASAFSTAGPVIYPLTRLYVERWPRTWLASGFEGYCLAPCVDALAVLTALTISTEYPAAVFALNPDYYWRLNDGQATLLFFDTSLNRAAPLAPNSSKYGPGTLAPGSLLALTGDPGGVGVAISGGSVAGKTGTGLQAGLWGFPPIATGGTGATWSMTVNWWQTIPTTPSAQQGILTFGRALGATTAPLGPTLSVYAFTGGLIDVTAANVAGLAGGSASGIVGDGIMHMFTLLVTVASGTMNVSLTIDRGNTGSASIAINMTTTFGSATADFRLTTVQLGGQFDPALQVNGYAATYAHLSIWNRALTAGQLDSLYSAGNIAFAGETTGTRIARHLVIGGYNGASRIDTGFSTMQAPTYSTSIDLLTDTLNTTIVEQGRLWVAPDGALVFEGRELRWLRLTSTRTLGENVAGGEVPYIGDIEFDFDPNFVFADVQITRNGGSIAIGGIPADIAVAARRFFPRSFTASGDLAADQNAQDMADWIFNSHRAPLQRIALVTLDPASNTQWPAILSLENGNRITVTRRASAANAGAGITILADFFIENISIDNVDFEAGTFTLTLLLSPIGVAPGVTMQPWILDNATLSVLGTTTVLGF